MTVQIEGYPAFEASPDVSLLELCEAQGIPMESSCGGFACCNSCRVEVLSGPQNLSPLLDEEEPFLDAPNQRLGCQATVVGPVSLRLDPGA